MKFENWVTIIEPEHQENHGHPFEGKRRFYAQKAWDYQQKRIDELEAENKRLRDCAILIQSILSHAEFIVETPNESALVKAMVIAGYPITVDKNTRDADFDYTQHQTFMSELIERVEPLEAENKRLREALERISGNEFGENNMVCEGYSHLKDISREALK